MDDNDTIRITAACDSLQALCEYYEREITRIRSDTSVFKTELKKEVSTDVQSPLKLLLAGFIAGMIVTLLYQLRIRN
jgi:hypothetical protein